jgi:16S rRNA (cytosine967-C5)-methyltransferase
LVYSTCTVLKEENEAVVERFLKAHPEFSLERFELPGIGSVEEGMITLWPHVHGTDGFFMAKIVKSRG